MIEFLSGFLSRPWTEYQVYFFGIGFLLGLALGYGIGYSIGRDKNRTEVTHHANPIEPHHLIVFTFENALDKDANYYFACGKRMEATDAFSFNDIEGVNCLACIQFYKNIRKVEQ